MLIMGYRISFKEMTERGKTILLKQTKPSLEKILKQVKWLKENSVANKRERETESISQKNIY
jgi:hypothetical protein